MTHARTLALVIAAAAAITTIAPAGAADLLKLTVGQRGNWDTSISYLGEQAVNACGGDRWIWQRFHSAS